MKVKFNLDLLYNRQRLRYKIYPSTSTIVQPFSQIFTSLAMFNYQADPSTWSQLGMVAVVTLYLSWIAVRAWVFFSHRLPYPPGPPVNNLLSGNLRGIPISKPWVTYTQWKKIYGNCISFSLVQILTCGANRRHSSPTNIRSAHNYSQLFQGQQGIT